MREMRRYIHFEGSSSSGLTGDQCNRKYQNISSDLHETVLQSARFRITDDVPATIEIVSTKRNLCISLILRSKMIREPGGKYRRLYNIKSGRRFVHLSSGIHMFANKLADIPSDTVQGGIECLLSRSSASIQRSRCFQTVAIVVIIIQQEDSRIFPGFARRRSASD